MKLVVEQSDIEEVKSVLKDWYGVVVGDELASKFLEDKGLASEIYEFEGLDTCGRECLAGVVLEYVMENVPIKVKGYHPASHWTWPLYGDSEEYKKAFNEEFAKAATAKNIQLTENWLELNEE